MADAIVSPILSVIIPTLNAGPDFASTLGAIRTQDTDLPFEIVVIDSGSTDDTLSLAAESGARIVEIPSSEFHHARTRNLAAKTCSGRYLVFLVQDAIPVNAHWLSALIKALDEERVVGAYSAQLPHQSASALAKRLTQAFQDSLTNLPRQQLEGYSLEELDESDRLALCRFDNVSSIMLREVWQAHPFPQVGYAEDVAWAKEVIEADYALRRVPESLVYHSHQRPLDYVLRREYIQARTLGSILGFERHDIERNQVIQLLQFGSLPASQHKLRRAMAEGLWSGTGHVRPALRYIERLFVRDAPQILLEPGSSIPLEVRQWLAGEATEDWIWRDLRSRLAKGTGSRFLKCSQKAAEVRREKGAGVAIGALFNSLWLFEGASYRDMWQLIGAAWRRHSPKAHALQDIVKGRESQSINRGLRSYFLLRVVQHWPDEYADSLKAAMASPGKQTLSGAIYESWHMAYWLWDGLEVQDQDSTTKVVEHAVAATVGRQLGEAAREGCEPQVRHVLDEQLARGV